MLRPLLQFRNFDSTQDLNDQFSEFFKRGIISGGQVVATGGLNIQVSPFKLMGSDGMVVIETSQTATLTLPNTPATYVVVFQSQYVANSTPLLGFEVLEFSAYTSSPNIEYLAVFAVITTTVVNQSITQSMIDYTSRDVLDPVQRLTIRGTVTNSSLLPLVNNRPGDGYLITTGQGDTPSLWVWNGGFNQKGATWVNITDASVVTSLLSAHRANLFSNEVHLTDEQAVAALGTYGIPGTVLVTPVTITVAAGVPGVITMPSPLTLTLGQEVFFSTTGVLPGGLIGGTAYYAIPLANSTTTFTVASTLANAQAYTAIILTGTQSGVHSLSLVGNAYVTDTDPRVPTLAEAEALQGTPATIPPSATNPYVTAAFTMAEPVAKSIAANTSLILTSADGPVFVGLGTTAESVFQYLRIYHETFAREYVNSVGSAVFINGVTDSTGTAGVPRPNPGSPNPNVDSDGFYTGTLYVGVTGTPDLPCRLIYGQKTQLNSTSSTGLTALGKESFLIPQPTSAQISQELLVRLQDISGRLFDDQMESGETNVELNEHVSGLKEYLNATTTSDLVVGTEDFPQLRNVPSMAADFPLDTAETPLLAAGYPYSLPAGATPSTVDPTITTFDATPTTAVVQFTYNPLISLSKVLPGHLFIDSAGIRFRILAVNNTNQSLLVYTGGSSVAVSATTGIGTSNGIYVANNPRQLELTYDSGISMGREIIPVEGLEPDLGNFEDLPPGGLAVGTQATPTLIGTGLTVMGSATGAPAGRPYHHILPKKQGRYESRVRLIGDWKQDQNLYPKQVVGQVSQGVCGIEYTGRLTDLILHVALSSTIPSGITVFVDGVYNAAASTFWTSATNTVALSSAIASFRTGESSSQPLFFPLGLDTGIHTVRIEFTQGGPTAAFQLYGIEVFFGTAYLEKGRAFTETDLIKTDTASTVALHTLSGFDIAANTTKGVRCTNIISRGTGVGDGVESLAYTQTASDRRVDSIPISLGSAGLER